MKKLIFIFIIFLVVMFYGIDSSFAFTCSPPCPNTHYCAAGFTAPGAAAGVTSGNGTCEPKADDGKGCSESFECKSGICTNSKCGAASDSTNPEQKTFAAVEKAISNFPAELNFADAGNDPYRIIGNVIKAFLGIIGTFALLIFIYGGIMWMLAGGSEQNVTKAQKTMVWAALGLFAIFVSYAAIGYVISAFKF